MGSVLIITDPTNVIPCHVEGGYAYCLRGRSDNAERQVAEMEWGTLTAPAVVHPGEQFTLTLKYKFLRRISVSSVDAPPINPISLPDWPGYYGAFRCCVRGDPIIGCITHTYWIWKFVGMRLYHNGVEAVEHGGVSCVDGKEWTYTWTGTIEQLTGRTFTQNEVVIGHFDMTGCIYGLWGAEHWPWEWPIDQNWIIWDPWTTLNYQISVEIPPPPLPIIDTNYCSVSKYEVTPTESLTIKVRVKNTNEGIGAYSIRCICEAQDHVLGAGIIGPVGSAGGIKDHIFNVTANGLAQRIITESTYLSYLIVLDTETEEQVDSWAPPNLAVIAVGGGGANLSGYVTDNTGLAIQGVSVKVLGYSATTNSSGYYGLSDLPVGTYTVTFSKSGYQTVTKSKALATGNNELTITMTQGTGGGDGIPWGTIVLVGGIAVGVILVASGLKGK